MKRHFLSFILIAFGLWLVVYLWKPLPPEIAPKPRLTNLERSVFVEVNKERRKHGLPDLIWREDVARVARMHSKNMGNRGFFSHDDPMTGDLKQRMYGLGVSDWARCGENLFKGRGSHDPVRQAVVGWMNSPGHRKNILNSAFTHTGIGVFWGRDRFLYFTQDFMLPR